MTYYVAKTGSLWFVLGTVNGLRTGRRFFSLDGAEMEAPTAWTLESYAAHESLDAALEAARTMKADAR